MEHVGSQTFLIYSGAGAGSVGSLGRYCCALREGIRIDYVSLLGGSGDMGDVCATNALRFPVAKVSAALSSLGIQQEELGDIRKTAMSLQRRRGLVKTVDFLCGRDRVYGGNKAYLPSVIQNRRDTFIRPLERFPRT